VTGAFAFVMLLIAAAPLVALYDRPPVSGLLAAIVAVTLGIIAIAMPRGEMAHQFKCSRTALMLLIIPGLWIVTQAMPMPSGLDNPVWQSAADALGRRLIGSITVDTGRTVLALIQYLTMLGLLIASSAVAVNRNRAARLLPWLTAATGAIALLLVVGELFDIASFAATETLWAGSALGVVTSAAAIIQVFEGYEAGRNKDFSIFAFLRTGALYFLAHTICWFAVVRFAPVQLAFGTACGFAVSILVVFIRGLRAGRWAIITFIGIAFAAVVGFAAAAYTSTGDVTVRFSSAPTVELSLAQRVRGDTGWLGSGAGSFAALAPIYQEPGSTVDEAPTTAAAVAIELGAPALFLIAIIALWLLGIFLRGALTRGRDSCYPALGASAVVILLIEGFVDASALQTSVMILVAVIAGLALAQIASRTANQPL
jgi:hypothetical protein